MSKNPKGVEKLPEEMTKDELIKNYRDLKAVNWELHEKVRKQASEIQRLKDRNKYP